jgi:insulysin
MGTEKYPEEEIYSKYISDYGGYNNAYTGLEQTNYHFEVSNEGFEKSLDMFAQFFIAPLMAKDSVDREMNAIESENNKNLQSDMWRFFQILQNESAPTCTLNRFNTGNLLTLKKDGVVDALKDFHKKWYSANIMNLCTVSNKSLDEQEKMVKEMFSEVENKDVTVPSFMEPECYPANKLCQLFKIKPVRDKHTIQFLWFYEYQGKDYYEKILRILGHVLGHEGENSLLSYLIAEDLATTLSSYSDHELSVFSYFDVNITLTDHGFKNYEKVIEIVGKAVKNLIAEGALDHVFEEISKDGALKWKYLEKSDATNTAVNTSDRMHLFTDENIKDMYESQYVFETFNKERYQQALNQLTPDNLNIYLSSKKVGELTDKEFTVCQWYKTEYVSEKIPDSLHQKMKNPTIELGHGLKLGNPVENTFFPNNLDILGDNEDQSKAVELIHSDDKIDVWYKKSDKWKTPKVVAINLLYTNDCGYDVTVDGNVFVGLFLKVMQDYYREFSYMAEMASMDASFSQSDGALRFDFRGYSEPIGEFINKYFEKLAHFKASDYKQTFEAKKEALLRDLANFALAAPYSQTLSAIKSFIFVNKFSVKEQLEVVKNLTFEHFVEQCDHFLKNGRSVWFINGNVSPDQAKNVAQSATETLGFTSIPKDKIMNSRACMVDQGDELTLMSDAENKDETNSALLSVYLDGRRQSVEQTQLSKRYHDILMKILDVPAFDYLRTKEQLGYICYLRALDYRDLIVGAFIVQSSVKSPEYVLSKCNEFITTWTEKLANLSDEDFEIAVKAIVMEKKENDTSMLVETYRLFTRVEKHLYDFDYRESQIKSLEQMIDKSNVEYYNKSKKAVSDHFKYLFLGEAPEEGKGPRIVNVQQIASQHHDDNLKQYDENTEHIKRSSKEIISDVKKFKNNSVLYPDIYMTRFAKTNK